MGIGQIMENLEKKDTIAIREEQIFQLAESGNKDEAKRQLFEPASRFETVRRVCRDMENSYGARESQIPSSVE